MPEPGPERVKLSDLTPDSHNANKGTERGRALLEKSLRQYGAGRSILLDKHGRIIAGNKTAEVASEIGLEDVVIVRTSGDKVVAVLREDLDLDSEAGRMIAYVDNRVGQVDLDWDFQNILTDWNDGDGLPLNDFWFDWELEQIQAPDNFDPMEEWKGMPEFEHEDKTSYQSIHIHFKNEQEVQEFAELIGQSLTEKTRSIWYSQREQMDDGAERYIS